MASRHNRQSRFLTLCYAAGGRSGSGIGPRGAGPADARASRLDNGSARLPPQESRDLELVVAPAFGGDAAPARVQLAGRPALLGAAARLRRLGELGGRR